MVRKNHHVVFASAEVVDHAANLAHTRVGTPQVAQGLKARRTEMMSELVVLHERAVDDGYAEVDVEQNRHRLQLAHDDVAQNAHEGKQSLAVRALATELPDAALIFLAQELEHGLYADAKHPDRMQQHQQRHASAAEPLEDGQLFAR